MILMKYKTVPALPDLSLSAVGFGCWGISGSDVWNQTDDAHSRQTIHQALDQGINFFDVAPIYGKGHAEVILGDALKGKRNEVIIASKCGLLWDDQGQVTNNLTRASILKEIDDSLRRLQTDYLDLYQLHWPDPETPLEETMSTLEALRTQGKIRYIGVSNFSVARTQEAMRYAPVASYQGLYNLLEHNPEHYHSIPLEYRTRDEVLPFCQEHGLAFLPYSPLFQGLLTGTFQASGNFDEHDARAANPKLNGETFLLYYEQVEALKAFAHRLGQPLNQVAINWLIAQDAVTSVISGGQLPEHVDQNVGSVHWELTPEQQQELEALLTPLKEAGYL